VVPGGARTLGSSDVFPNSIKDGVAMPTLLQKQDLAVKYTM
jgi:hypothetical protein